MFETGEVEFWQRTRMWGSFGVTRAALVPLHLTKN
jgi:hypothetical protein